MSEKGQVETKSLKAERGEKKPGWVTRKLSLQVNQAGVGSSLKVGGKRSGRRKTREGRGSGWGRRNQG